MTEFLVVSVPNKEFKAKIELLDAILLVDKDVKVIETERKNTFKIVTKLNENDFLHLVFSSLPRYTVRVIPIYKTCNLDKNEVLTSALSLLKDLDSNKKIKVVLKSKKSLRSIFDPIKEELLKAVRTKGYELDIVSPEVILYLEAIDNKVIISLLKSSLPLSLHSLRDKACEFVKHITKEKGT